MRTTPCGRSRRGRPAAVMVRVLLSALFAALVVVPAPPAAAHTALKSSDPKAGARVTAPPDRITLEFTEPVRAPLTRVIVQGPGDARFESGPPQVSSATVVQQLRALEAAGEYEIVYRIVAADGHPLTGTVRFNLTRPGSGASAGATSSAAPAPSSSADSGVEAAPTGADGDGDVSPWLIGIGAVAAAAFVAGAVWFGRRATRDLE